MRRSLLNKRILPKPLRQALVLFTLLLLPNAAWGQDPTNYPLYVLGVQITSGNCEHIENINPTVGTITSEDGGISFIYNSTDNTGTLTLNGATITRGGGDTASPVISLGESLDKLTIEIKGNNFISNNTDAQIFIGTKLGGTQADFSSIEFTGTGSLTLQTTEKSTIIGKQMSFDNLNISYKDGLNPLYLAPTSATSMTTASKVMIANPYSGLTIAGVEVNDEGTFTGLTGVSYTPASSYNSLDYNTWPMLTLDNATIDGVIVWNGLLNLNLNLNIEVKGNNIIRKAWGGDTPQPVVQAEQACSLKVTKTTGASLALASYNDEGDADVMIHTNFGVVLNEFGASPTFIFDNSGFKYHLYYDGDPFYLLTVGQNSVHKIPGLPGYKENILGGTPITATYDADNRALVLNNANIISNVVWSDGTNPFTIKISGTNSIEYRNSQPAIYCTTVSDGPSLKIQKTDDGASLKVASYTVTSKVDQTDIISPADKNIDGFSNISSNGYLDEGLNSFEYSEGKTGYDGSVKYTYITDATVYDLKVGGVQVHDISNLPGYKENILGDTENPTVTFDGTTGTLTLNNAQISGNIVSGLSSLTIRINGNNYIGSSSIMGNITTKEGINIETSLTLEKENSSSTLTINYAGDGCPISGFNSFINSDFALFGIGGDSSTSLPGSFSYNNKQLKWSDENIIPTKMMACVLFESEGTAYKIQNESDLAKLASFVNQGILTNQYFKLTEGFTCSSDFTMDQIGSSVNFIGTFDGGGNTISNLTLSTNALFRMMGSGGTVKDLILDNLKINSDGSYTAAIADHLHEGNTISGCIVKNSEIKCINTTQYPYIGGIVGRLYGGTVSGCTVENTTITGETTDDQVPYAYVGGIASEVDNGGKIEGCFVKGNTVITASRTDVGSVIYAGAITPSAPSAEALTNNYYEYSVIVKTKGPDDSDYQIKNKYTHRGTNADTDPDGAVMYTKDVIIPTTNNGGYVSIDYDYYYKVTSDNNNTTYTYSVAPSEEVLVSVEGAAIEGSYTLDNETKAITLTPKEDSSYGYTFDMPDADVTFTIQKAAWVEMFEEQTYATYYNPNEDMAVPMGMTAYIVTGISEDGTKVTVSPVSYIKAGVAVLVEKGEIGEISETTDFSGSKMAYSDPDTPAKPSATDKWYVIYNNKFVKVTTGTEVSGGKCYLNLNGTSSSGTRSYYDIDGSDGTTALREVKSEGVKGEKSADGEWYTLQGRKFTTKPTKPGLYILNGKKIVVK